MNKTDSIYVAGHRGLVGNAVLRKLQASGYTNIITKTRQELNLLNQPEVDQFFSVYKPNYVILAAAKVGGIGANAAYPADFIYENIMIGSNVVHGAYKSGVKKLINLGSSCIYPKLAPQPLKEEYLLTGPLEPTNDAYAVAKIAIIKLCNSYNLQHGTNFISVMPTNLYGPGDNYDIETGHVLAALISKFHIAKTTDTHKVTLWGDGSPLREFLYNEDLAEAILFLLENKDASDIGELINIGTGIDQSIKELADLIKNVIYHDLPETDCAIEWDTTKPNGTPRKLMDVSKMTNLGWSASTSLIEGLKKTYTAFLSSNP